MPTSLTKIQLGYLQRLVWWVSTKSIYNPFSFKFEYGEAIFEVYKTYRIQTTWKTIRQDLQTFAGLGYIQISESDGKTLYLVTPAGLEAGTLTQ